MHTIFPATTSNVRLGLGGAAIGNLYKAITDAEAHGVVQAALDDGCRAFDTAPHYGNGLSEHRVGAALRTTPPDQRFISTKVGRILLPDPHAPRDQNGYVDVLPFVQRWDYSRDGIRRSVEDSMQRLGVARIDVAFIHDCDEVTHGAAYATVVKQVASEAIPELQRHAARGDHRTLRAGCERRAGLPRRARVQPMWIACCSRDATACSTRARWASCFPCACSAACASRSAACSIPAFSRPGVANRREPIRFNYGPASQDWIRKTAAIEEACARFDVPLRAAALQFPLAHPAIDVVIAGAQLPAHWKDAVDMLAVAIPDAFWQELKALGLVPERRADARGIVFVAMLLPCARLPLRSAGTACFH